MRFAGQTDISQYMSTPDFTGLSRTMLQGQSMQRDAANTAKGASALAGIQSLANVKGAGFQAEAIKAQGAAQGQQAMASGLGSMFSGLAGGIGSLGGGGASKYGYDPVGSQGFNRVPLNIN